MKVLTLKIKSIEMSWFRGASESITLDTNSKNVVVYGTNGSGKSSFVDALEYVIQDGHIEHLSHEYSGSRQKNSIINTHIPESAKASIKIIFTNDEKITAEIQPDGNKSFSSEPKELIKTLQSWKIENYILRQDEVSKFIYLTKGQKYSVLLPLLGLEELESVVDNLKKTHNKIKEDSKEEAVRIHRDRLKGVIQKYYSNCQDPSILETLSKFCTKYNIPFSGDIKTDAHNLLRLINEKISTLSPDNTRYQILKQCSNEQLTKKIEAYEKSKELLAKIASEIIDKKIEILQATSEYLERVDKAAEIICPACGRVINYEDFNAHIEAEMSELEEAREIKQKFIRDEKDFLASFNQILKLLNNNELNQWMIKNGYENIVNKVKELLGKIKKSEYIDYHSETGLLCKFIQDELGESPPEITELITSKEVLMAIRKIPGILALDAYHSRVKGTIDFLEKCESLTQKKIKEKAEIKILEITEKLQYLWSKIHPNELIEDVKLYIPEDADKAIDISLKFFGVEQPSPRVTLSEGHRNSLGLCIFLALALSHESDNPIILDDIISSLDRDHRNRVIDILKGELSDRQVILFTHDRSWYIELITLLPEREWSRLVLKPWVSPEEGIQWAKTSFWFDDARELILDHPDLSAHKARAIMDSYLGIAVEKLLVELPYRSGDANDKKTCR